MNRPITVSLKNGDKIPLLGLGTWSLRGRECTKTVECALELGYRHIDTAHVYENHSAIAKALAAVSRSHLFITSKLSMDQVKKAHLKSSVEKACDLALKELNLEYLDLYLIHWPDRTKDMIGILQAMHRLREKGKIRNVGVSNFTIHHLQDILKEGIEIAANQVEFHPYLYQKDLWKFCKQNQIQLISYRPLGKGKLLEDPLFRKVGKIYQKTPAQVLLRWVVQKKIPVIPKASGKPHLKENINIFDFSLSYKDMMCLDALNRNERFCDASWSEFDY